jgi:hypothetical protein
MKTTTAFIDKIKPEQREKRREKSSEYYTNNKDRLINKNKLSYYSKKYGDDLVKEYVSKYGDDAVSKIKENTKHVLVNIN